MKFEEEDTKLGGLIVFLSLAVYYIILILLGVL